MEHLNNYNVIKNINKRFKTQSSKINQFKISKESHNSLKNGKSKTERYPLKSSLTIVHKLNDDKEKTKRIILPYTTSNINLIGNENIISNSENSYSSTFNSSSRLFPENTIKNHLTLNNNNSKSMFKKYKSHISRNIQDKNNNLKSNSPQNTIDHFILRKKTSINNTFKLNKDSGLKNYFSTESYRTIDKRYYSSRNYDHGPIKVLSMNEDNFKTFNSSSLNSNSSLNQNSLSNTHRINSLDYLNIKLKKNNHLFNSPGKNQFDNDDLELNSGRTYTQKLYNKTRSHDYTNSNNDFNDFIPIFNRHQSHNKIKKYNLKLSHRYIKQLSQIPENGTNVEKNINKSKTIKNNNNNLGIYREKNNNNYENNSDNNNNYNKINTNNNNNAFNNNYDINKLNKNYNSDNVNYDYNYNYDNYNENYEETINENIMKRIKKFEKEKKLIIKKSTTDIKKFNSLKGKNISDTENKNKIKSKINYKRKSYDMKNENPLKNELIEDIKISFSDDELYLVEKYNKNNSENFLINNQKILKEKYLKGETMLFFFEENLKEPLTKINEKCTIKKQNIIEIRMKEISKNMVKTVNYFQSKIKNYFQKNKTSLKTIKNKLFYTKFFKKLKFFLYKMQKSKKKNKISYHSRNINQFFPGEYLFIKNFEVNILNQLTDKYLNHDFDETTDSTITIIKNFLIKSCQLKRSTNIKKNDVNSFLSYLIPSLQKLPELDFYFIVKFHQIDYEYFIIPDTSSVKLDNVKLKIPSHFSPNLKGINNRRISIPSNYKLFQKDENKLKNIDKAYLQNALKKSDFFRRLKIIRPQKKTSLVRLQNSYKELQNILYKPNINSMNRIDIISKSNELKQQIFNSLKSHCEEIIFYIKDRNYPCFVETFEKYKISPNSKNAEGDSLLSIAVKSNCFQIVNYLLNAGATPNINNKNNNTPLHYALTFHNFEIADMLIQRGADEKAENIMGITPWQCLDSGHSIL